MIDALLQGLLNMLGGILDIVLAPINYIVDSLFPNVSTMIGIFSEFITNYIGGALAYFGNFIPPITRSIISTWLVFTIAYYGIAWGYTLIVKIWNLIQKLKFW